MGKGPVTLGISPGDYGINLTTSMGTFPLDPDHCHPYIRRWGRLLVVTTHKVNGKPRLRDVVAVVPEHVMAALHLLKIPHAELEIKESILRRGEHLPWHCPFSWGIPWNWKAASFPVFGGTSEKFYNELVDNREANGKKLPVYRVERSFEYSYKQHMVRVEPHDSFKVVVAGMPDDPWGYSPLEVKMENVYEDAIEHVCTRALDTPPLVKKVKSWGSFFVGYDNCPTLNPTKQKTIEEKVQAMHEPYRAGRNEQLHHVVLDVLGEWWCLIRGEIQGYFYFYDSNHITRMPAFKRMLSEGVIRRYES